MPTFVVSFKPDGSTRPPEMEIEAEKLVAGEHNCVFRTNEAVVAAVPSALVRSCVTKKQS